MDVVDSRVKPDMATKRIDAVKGFFIVAIVIGHNTLLTRLSDYLFPLLYSFHVFAFLFLPFVFAQAPLRAKATLDRGIRYLVPYTFFFLLSCILFVLVTKNDLSIDHIISGLLIGSAYTLDRASGFQLYWFLPAIFTLFLLRGIDARLSVRNRLFLLLGLVFIHPLVGELPESVKRFTPFGVWIVLYVYPLGVLASAIWKKVESRRAEVAIVSFVIATVCAVWILRTHSVVNLAVLELYGFQEPVSMLVHDVFALVVFIGALAIGNLLASSSILVLLGKYSMFVYLSHSLIFQAITRLACQTSYCMTSASNDLLAGVLVLVLTLAVAAVCAVLVARKARLQSMLFPRSLSDWMAACGRVSC